MPCPPAGPPPGNVPDPFFDCDDGLEFSDEVVFFDHRIVGYEGLESDEAVAKKDKDKAKDKAQNKLPDEKHRDEGVSEGAAVLRALQDDRKLKNRARW